MTGYQKLISEVTGVTEAEYLAEIEAIMRDETGGTLDHLGPQEFAELASNARLIADAVRGM